LNIKLIRSDFAELLSIAMLTPLVIRKQKEYHQIGQVLSQYCMYSMIVHVVTLKPEIVFILHRLSMGMTITRTECLRSELSIERIRNKD